MLIIFPDLMNFPDYFFHKMIFFMRRYQCRKIPTHDIINRHDSLLVEMLKKEATSLFESVVSIISSNFSRICSSPANEKLGTSIELYFFVIDFVINLAVSSLEHSTWFIEFNLAAAERRPVDERTQPAAC